MLCAICRIIAMKKKVPLSKFEIEEKTLEDPDRQSEIFPFREIPFWNRILVEFFWIPFGLNFVQFFLPIVEIFGNNFQAGLLGPGLVFGSGAFNLK